MKTMIKTQATTLAAAIAFTFAAFAGVDAARAAGVDEAPTKTVGYADLNLDSRSGAQVLYVRLRAAAREVCSPFEGREPAKHSAWQACYKNAVSSAVTKVNKTMVTSVHNEIAGQAQAG